MMLLPRPLRPAIDGWGRGNRNKWQSALAGCLLLATAQFFSFAAAPLLICWITDEEVPSLTRNETPIYIKRFLITPPAKSIKKVSNFAIHFVSAAHCLRHNGNYFETVLFYLLLIIDFYGNWWIDTLTL